MTTAAWQIITGVIILAVIFMLVRPGSPAAQAVQDVSQALVALVQTATDYSGISGGTTNG